MPRGDRSGPQGLGPMTGRAAGYCAGYATPGFMNPAGGRGMGWGRGGEFGRGIGRGYGRGFTAYPAAYPVARSPQPYVNDTPIAPEDELKALREQSEFIARSLDAINERIAELAADGPKPEKG